MSEVKTNDLHSDFCLLLLFVSSDDREQTPGASVERFFAAVREEKIIAADRTKWRGVNALGLDARIYELVSVGSLQINARVPFARRDEKLWGIGETRVENIDDFKADLVAADISGGADGRANILGARAIIFVHPFESGGNNLSRRAAPPGMDGGASPGARVA